MDWIVNTRLLSNPMNWFSIAAMLVLTGLMAVAIHSRIRATSSIAADLPDNAAAEMAKES